MDFQRQKQMSVVSTIEIITLLLSTHLPRLPTVWGPHQRQEQVILDYSSSRRHSRFHTGVPQALSLSPLWITQIQTTQLSTSQTTREAHGQNSDRSHLTRVLNYSSFYRSYRQRVQAKDTGHKDELKQENSENNTHHSYGSFPVG